MDWFKRFWILKITFVITMPVVFRTKGFRFFLYSEEGEEPIHIDINKADARGKIWIEPEIAVEYMYGFTVREERDIKKLVNEHIELIKKTWNEYFG